MFNLIAVDDEQDVKVLFEHFFDEEVTSGNLNLTFQSSGIEVLGLLDNLKGPIIVLTDINMPKMNGIELLKQISLKHKAAKVILVSAYDEDRYSSEMKQWGAEGYISKPVDFMLLKEQVMKLFKSMK